MQDYKTREPMTPPTTSAGIDQPKDKAGETVDKAKATVGQVVDQAKGTAGEVIDQAKATATSQVSDKKEQAAEGLGAVAATLRQTSEQLQNQNVGPFVGIASRAADYVDDFSRYLRDTDVREMINDIEAFSRRQPMLFLGGAFVLGLLGARFLKSSTPEPPMPMSYYNDNYGDTRRMYPGAHDRPDDTPGYPQPGSTRSSYMGAVEPHRPTGSPYSDSQYNREE